MQESLKTFLANLGGSLVLAMVFLVGALIGALGPTLICMNVRYETLEAQTRICDKLDGLALQPGHVGKPVGSARQSEAIMLRDLALHLGAPLLGGSLILLGQVVDSDNALKWLTSGGGYGMLGWYMYHTTTVSIPRIVKEFRDEMALVRAEGKQEREMFQATLDALRKQFERREPPAGG